jgi:glycosyltransferase involved in cell wall biosynthesis
MPSAPVVDAVIIGRNEGARLVACLQSVAGQVRQMVYVDSGSTDGSVGAAQATGAMVVPLDPAQPFTAARARNAGLARLTGAEFALFIDGDCVLQPGFVGAALAAFQDHPAAVVVCGRRREMHPDASVYNRLCDAEWNTPIGPARACGGDALIRVAPLQAAGGYRASLIAGEEPELCLRLRARGGQVWRIDADMTRHDAGLLRFGQWWRRSLRAGHAYAEGAFLHGAGPERHWVAETRRALAWGLGLPVVTIAAGLAHPAGWLLGLAYPAQVGRLALRDRDAKGAVLSVIGKFAESLGILRFHAGRLAGRRRGLIEYR